MSDLILERLAQQNNRQVIEKSNRYHLIQDAGTGGGQVVKLHDRCFSHLGEWMIKLGHDLKERHPVPEHRPALGETGS